jgi:hypothetical protein
MLTNAVAGETPQTIAAAHDALGPEGFVGDLNHPLSRLTKSIADQPEAAAGDIRAAYAARAKADAGRIDSAITQALGPAQDVSALTRNDQIARSAAADPLYEAWRNTQIPPTDQIRSLLPRLNAAGVSAGAANKMAIEGIPGFQQWFTRDPVTGQLTLDTEKSPTAQTFDYMKQALDDKIGSALKSGENGQARLYQGLKSDLVNAIDNHPDPNVSGVWKAARQAWSDPTSIISARQEGASALSKTITPSELKDQFNSYTPPEQQAFIQGLRGNIANAFGATKYGDTTVKNQLLAPNNQAKIAALVGQNKADALVKSLQQEDALAEATKKITGGSPTHENMQASVLSGPAAIPGKVSNYIRNFSIDKPATWLGMAPGSVIPQAEAAALAKARSQLSPLLTTPNGQNAEMARQLLELSAGNAARQSQADQVRNLATMLLQGAGQEQRAQRNMPLVIP